MKKDTKREIKLLNSQAEQAIVKFNKLASSRALEGALHLYVRDHGAYETVLRLEEYIDGLVECVGRPE